MVKAVERVNSVPSVIHALGESIHKTLDKLANGSMTFESGSELASTVNAVAQYIDLKLRYQK